MIRHAVLRADAAALRRAGDPALLAWQLREFCRFGIDSATLPDAAAALLPELQAGLPRPMRLDCAAPTMLAQPALLWDGGALVAGNLAPLLVAPGHRLAFADGTPSGLCALPAGPVPTDEALAALPMLGSAIPRVDAAQDLLRRRALFLDRDGVINLDHGYVGTRERFEWVPGARAAIRRATEAGWHVFVVTNQSGVARGLFSEADVRALLGWMADELRAAGGTVDDWRYCPHHPEAALAGYRQDCACRKPAPGMITDLLASWRLDPARALLVGDQQRDIVAATAAGVAGRLFPGGNLDEFLAPLLA